jgi:hypothetical protein
MVQLDHHPHTLTALKSLPEKFVRSVLQRCDLLGLNLSVLRLGFDEFTHVFIQVLMFSAIYQAVSP